MPKGHKPNCNCCICKAKRGDSPKGENSPRYSRVVKKCLWCGNSFEVLGNRAPVVKYCSLKCSGLSRRTLRETRICIAPGCNNAFECKIDSPKKYCCPGHTMKGRKAIKSSWSKGLTKETDERVLKASITIKAQYDGGRKPHNWAGGVGNFLYPSEFSEKFKTLIRERDNHTCQRCGRTKEEEGKNLTVHHIYHDSSNPDMDPERFITLCRGCNTKVNFDKEYWTKFFRLRLEVMKVA